jgi:hypothetical protein
MGNFSKSPGTVLAANQTKGYVGIHIEQGVPVLDRDLNLMHDFLAAAVRSLLAKYIGDGVIGSGFLIQTLSPAANNFKINAGTALVGGIEATFPAAINYSDQAGLPPLNGSGLTARQDVVFLDVSLSEVDGSVDPDLTNSDDVGVQTSVRDKLNRVVRVAENTTAVPAPAAGHFHLALARISRPVNNTTITPSMLVDLRKQILPLLDLTQLVRVLTSYGYGFTGINTGLI